MTQTSPQSPARIARGGHPFASILRAIDRAPAYQKLRDALDSEDTREVHIAGLAGSLAPCLLAQLYQKSPRPTLVVTVSPDAASWWHDDLLHLLGEKHVSRFHSWEILPYEFRCPGPESTGRRLETLWRMLDEQPPIVVTHLRAALEPTISPDDLLVSALSLSVGQEILIDELLARLIELGYRRQPLVEEVGRSPDAAGLSTLLVTLSQSLCALNFSATRSNRSARSLSLRNVHPASVSSVSCSPAAKYSPRAQSTRVAGNRAIWTPNGASESRVIQAALGWNGWQTVSARNARAYSTIAATTPSGGWTIRI